MRARFFRQGWLRFGHDPVLSAWLDHVRAPALATRNDAALARQWLTCAGTWFIGVNALDNDAQGRVADANGQRADAPPLAGEARTFITRELGVGWPALDRAQVSIVYPGYPQRREDESDAAFRFRCQRDAAHVDGLHRTGPDNRRLLLEFQGFLLGIPLSCTGEGAAPLVVWEGSHRIMGETFREALANCAPADWTGLDLTERYQAARRRVFETCRRVEVHARPGEAYVLHRMALHGVAPWREGAEAPDEGRAILYFRPEIDRELWRDAP